MANGRPISVITPVKGFLKADQDKFSPSPCDCGAWSPAAPWPSGSGCAPCHQQGSRSRCQHRRWAEESAGWLRTFEHVWWVMAAETRQLDKEIPKQAHILLLYKSPHRRTLPISVPLLIHLKASDSPSFLGRFIFQSGFLPTRLALTAGSYGVRPKDSWLYKNPALTGDVKNITSASKRDMRVVSEQKARPL